MAGVGKPGPRPTKGPKCVAKSVSIREDTYKALDRLAREREVSVSSLITEAIDVYLDSTRVKSDIEDKT